MEYLFRDMSAVVVKGNAKGVFFSFPSLAFLSNSENLNEQPEGHKPDSLTFKNMTTRTRINNL